IAAGAGIRRFGRRRALVWLGGFQVLAALAVVPMAYGMVWPWYVGAVVGLANAAFAAGFAIVYTICMDLTRPESAGTDFTLFTTIGSLVMVLCAGIGIALSGLVGFGPVAIGAGLVAAVGVAFAAWGVGEVLEERTPVGA
ncbi:MAG: hypothetical protein ACTH0C_00370, partial [Actinomycetaceae bacterium]